MLLTLFAACAIQGDVTTPERFVLPNDFGDAGTGSIEFQVGVYDRTDSPGDGNPFLDESVTVIEPILVFDYNVSDTFGYSALVVYDNVSSASIDRLSNFPEQSGASGDNYIGADIGFRWKTSDRTSLGLRAGFAFEYDYQSLHVGGDYSWERADQDAKLTFSLDGFFDTVEPILWNGVTLSDEDRTSIATTVNWYQILGPKTHGDFGLTVSIQDGFLETPYNSVVQDNGTGTPNTNLDNNAAGDEFREIVPDDRFRTALFGRVRHQLRPGHAVEMGGRFYTDDWGINAFELSPRWFKSFNEGKNLLELHYRFYTQGEADFYQREIFDDAVALPKERSQDADLGDFNSNNVGVKWTWDTSDHSTWTFAVDYSKRDDDLDNIYGLIGYRWSF